MLVHVCARVYEGALASMCESSCVEAGRQTSVSHVMPGGPCAHSQSLYQLNHSSSPPRKRLTWESQRID